MIRIPAVVLAVILFVPCFGTAKTLKYAVVIGNNRGHDAARTLRYAEQDAEKFYKTITELGGFPTENSVLLLGADASEVSAALASAESRIRALSGDAATKTMLIVYYSGHAEGDVLELNDTSLPMAEVLRQMRDSSAGVRLAFMDSCRSGTMVAMKGGRPGPGFNIQVADEIASNGYAIITSSSESELSQESKEIRGAFFTHYLISAMRGDGDASNDGVVTLSEAYDYAFRRTVARTRLTVGGAQHPMYEFRLEGQGDIVLTDMRSAVARLAVRLPESGRLLVVNEARGSVAAEADMQVDETARIALPSGTYQVYLVSEDGSVHASSVTLAPNANALLDAADFEPVELTLGVEKGGLFPDEGRPWHRLSLGGVWRRFPLEGATGSWGASLAYRVRFTSGWQPMVRLNWTTRPDVGLSSGYHDVGAQAGMGYALVLRRASLEAGLLVGYEHLFQSPRDGMARHTSGFDYLALAGLSLPVERIVFSLEAGVGGRTFQVRDKGWVHRLDFQTVLSIGWRWPG